MMSYNLKQVMLIGLLLYLLPSIYGLPQGAPNKVCQTMLPFHGGGIPPQRDASTYVVQPRRQQGAVIVTLKSQLGVPFRGFMLQARTPDGRLLGVFESVGEFAHTMDCQQTADSATHNNPDPKNVLELKWRPPENYEGFVVFNSTIAQDYATFWVGIQSPPVQISRRAIDDPISNFPKSPITTTPPYFITPSKAKESSAEFDPFYSGCGSRKLCFGSPTGCVTSKNCKAAVAVTVTGDKYDFEMKATGNAAWVGVGLSDDDKMGDDSVVECVRRGSGVDTFMSWTSGAPNYGAERLRNKLGIQLLNGSIVDDTIYCKVRREAQTNVRGRLFDLMNDRYYLLVASGSKLKSAGVDFHDLEYLASGKKQSLSDVSSVGAASKLLIRLHGSFMLAAWIGTASLGILLARYYRQTWVGSTICGKDIWFAWHRFFMVLTWALTITAFVLIFVELKAWSAERNPHAILGTVTTILCFFQPIGAYFRPHPGTSKRPIFNWLHWFIGNAAHIIGIVTIFFAVKLKKAELPEFVDWILVAYVAFHVVVHLILSVMGCISEKSSESRISSFPMKDLGGSGRSSAYMDRNVDAPYSGFRKFLLGLYILIILALVIALIVITALAPIEQYWQTLKDSMMNS